MSDYGPDYGRPGPPGPPPGAAGGPASPGGSSTPARQSSSGDPAQFVMITNYVAAGLGVLAFVWGFLSWFKQGSASLAGYSVFGAGAAAVIGLSLAAGLMAAATTLEKKSTTLVPATLALSAFLVAVGIIIDKGSVGQADAMVGTGIGLILALVTTILQTLALAYGWALSAGRVAAPQSQPKAPKNAQNPQHPQNPWGGPPQGQPGSGYGPAPSYQGGQQSGGQQYPPAAPSYQYGGQYDSPTQGQPVQGQPGQGQPGQGQPQPGQQQPGQQQPGQPQPGQSQGNPYGPPPGASQGNPYGPPPGASQGGQPGQQQPGRPQGNPYGSPPPDRSSESSQGYGEATRHIPRFPTPSESESDGPSQSGPSQPGPSQSGPSSYGQ